MFIFHNLFSLGRLFVPNVKVNLFDENSKKFEINETFEKCLSEKILELAKIRPIFRFSIFDFYFSVQNLETYFQFGNGHKYKVNT